MKRVSRKSYKTLIAVLILSLLLIGGVYALLTDRVIIKGTATIKEVDRVSLEIGNVEFVNMYDAKGGFDHIPEYSLAEDKKSFTVDLGTVRVDQNGTICGVDEITNPEIDISGPFGATFKVTVFNTGNKPVVLSTGVAGENVDVRFGWYDDGFTINDEILAPGAACIFTVVFETKGGNYPDGTKVSTDFSVIGTEYTGEEIPRDSHEHETVGTV